MDNEQEGQIEGLEWDSAKLRKEISFYLDQLYAPLGDYSGGDDDDDEFWAEYEEPQLTQLKERLALYRIIAHEISEGRPPRDFAELREEYPPPVLEEERYFEGYEWSFGWYFDPEYCDYVGFQDYQRLVLRETHEYHDWKKYRGTSDTYEVDRDFVKFYEKLASETKWIENCLTEGKVEWGRIKCVAFYQAMKIAAGFGSICRASVYFYFTEFIWSVWFDYSIHKLRGRLYFEIWKRVAKQKMIFVDALKQIHEQGICPSFRFEMKYELDRYSRESGSMKGEYNTYVAHIDEKVQEGKAHMLIMKAVTKSVPKPKTYYDYVKKKLNVAEEIDYVATAQMTTHKARR